MNAPTFPTDAIPATREMDGTETACPKCGLEFRTLLHPFCQHEECPPREHSLKAGGYAARRADVAISDCDEVARLRGHLASIVADPDCCAVSKQIARAALAQATGGAA